jgi:signal transduction histidine kinase/CheY-like chemotaxis protein
VVAWTVTKQDILSPPVHGGAVSALISHVSGQWLLGLFASFLLESFVKQMLESKALLAKHNETLETEVAAQTRIIRQQQEHLFQSQKMEALGQLAGGIAHDFNNLLTIIRGRGELLYQEVPDDERLRSHIEEIIHASKSSSELTQQLLAFSRKQVMELRTISLNAVVNKLKKMLKPLLGEDIKLESELSDSIGSVEADVTQIEQVVVNLVVNARDATPEGGIITISTSNCNVTEEQSRQLPGLKVGRYVLLSVKDTGTGMTDEVKAHLFEPFFTTKGPGRGTGLGLSTIYGIVRQMGGDIVVESTLGKGTTFKIYLPAVEGKPVELQSAVKPGAVPSGTETILLVEDQDQVRALAVDILKKGGYTVLDTRDPSDALRLLQGHPGHVPLLLTDVIMPGMKGTMLARKILDISPATKVLYMSGYTGDEFVQKEVLTKGQAFIEKPFTPEKLLRKVREVLDTPRSAG